MRYRIVTNEVVSFKFTWIIIHFVKKIQRVTNTTPNYIGNRMVTHEVLTFPIRRVKFQSFWIQTLGVYDEVHRTCSLNWIHLKSRVHNSKISSDTSNLFTVFRPEWKKRKPYLPTPSKRKKRYTRRCVFCCFLYGQASHTYFRLLLPGVQTGN